MKHAGLFFTFLAIAATTGCTGKAVPKKPKQYTVNVLRDDLPVDEAQIRLVVWRKSETPGAVVDPADVLYETRTDKLGGADIPVKRKSSFGIKATACLEDSVWAGDAWVSRKSEKVQINLEQTETACLGE